MLCCAQCLPVCDPALVAIGTLHFDCLECTRHTGRQAARQASKRVGKRPGSCLQAGGPVGSEIGCLPNRSPTCGKYGRRTRLGRPAPRSSLANAFSHSSAAPVAAAMRPQLSSASSAGVGEGKAA